MPQSRLNAGKIMKWYWAIAVVFIVIASSFAAFSIHKDYLNRSHDAAQKAMLFAQALAEQTTRMIDALDALSRAVKRDVTERMVSDDALSEVLRRRTQAETKAVVGMAVLDSSGRVYASDIDTVPIGSDLSQSEEYKFLSRPGSPLVFVNHPSVRETNPLQNAIGETMSYSRVILDRQDKFQGLVTILVNESYLYNNTNARLEAEPDIVSGLIGKDGVIRASSNSHAVGRYIENQFTNELAAEQGVQVTNSPLSNHQFILAYYKSSAISLWAYAGFPTEPIRRAWLMASYVMLAALLLIFGVIIACGILLKKYVISQKELLRRDIEIIKERQELEIFQTIARASDLLMVVTDAEGKIIVTNQNFQNIFNGTENNEQLSFKSTLGIDLSLLRNELSWQGTHTVSIAGGRHRELNWVVSIIRSQEDNQVRNFVILGLDITERREAELAIYQSSKLLTLGQMATGIAHELSQPLATLAMMLDNLEHSVVQKNMTWLVFWNR